jgi:regulator of sigma E protease
METAINIIQTVGIFIGAIMILVFIHELGHFLAAKLFGMRVERFSVGFPPRIWGFEKGGTDYCIGATPLGGYVKISGMIDESMDTDQMREEPKPWEYRSKPVWQRMIVIVAGVVFNMLLAVVIFFGITFFNGRAVIPIESVEHGVYIPEGSLAEDVGFRTGDQIIAVNGQEVEYFNDLFSTDELTKPEIVYTVIRDGQEVEVVLEPSFLDRIEKEGFISVDNIYPSRIGAVAPGSPASQAGIQPGDRFLSADGKPTLFWFTLVEAIQNAEGEILFEVERDGEVLEIPITPNLDSKTIGIQQASLLQSGAVLVDYGFFESLAQGVEQTVVMTTTTVQGFARMFSGDISVRQNLGGVVQIATVTKQATDASGWIGFWNITALLSITLAFINILPIPALDGGHLVFLIFEGVTRRKPSEKVSMALQQIGFFILLALIILVNGNDILRLFGI